MSLKLRLKLGLFINKQIWTSFLSSQAQVVRDQFGSFTAQSKSIKYWWLIKELLKFTPKCNKTYGMLFYFLGFCRKEDIGLVWLLITLMWVIKKLPLIQSKKKKKRLPLMVNGLLRIIRVFALGNAISSHFTISKIYFINYTIPFYNTLNIPTFIFLFYSLK